MNAEALRHAATLLQQAQHVAVLTGAGMSAESGIPTFRDALNGNDGLWSQFDPMQLASAEGFAADPALVWRWYAWRREGVLAAKPHAGHVALAEAAARFESFALVTQNVDGLHARAGSRDVVELHGNILRSQCFRACGFVLSTLEGLPPGEPPACPNCGAWLRPGVVWFGEMLDPQRLQRAQEVVEQAEVVLVVGTSGLVYPAAGLPALAKQAGARVVIVNPVATELDSGADLVIRATAAQALPALLPRIESG